MINKNLIKENILDTIKVSISRNIQGFLFPNKIKNISEAENIISMIKQSCDEIFQNNIIYTKDLSSFEKESLIYEEIASKKLLENEFSAIIINKIGDLKIFINENDHLKIVCDRRKLGAEETYKIASILDDELSKKLKFCFNNKLGYLTSELNLLGTGLRVSANLFLFASIKTNNLNNILKITNKYDLILFNNIDNSKSCYDYSYQIMNKNTINISDNQIIENINNAINEIKEEETKQFIQLLTSDMLEVKDNINRSLSLLMNAYKLSYSEFLRNISNIRVAIIFDMINLKYEDIEYIKNKVSPVSLCQKFNNQNLDNNDTKRAEIVRKYFKDKLI